MKTEFKGTKGEWVIKNTVTSSVYGVEKKAIFPENKQGFYDKSICHIDCNNQYGLSEHEANAKLISCAPEMLEMLHILLSDISGKIPDSPAKDSRIEQVKQLIIKSTTI